MNPEQKKKVEEKVAELIETLKPDAFVLMLSFKNEDGMSDDYIKGKGEAADVAYIREKLSTDLDEYIRETIGVPNPL